jgi:hypothetical protein
LWAKERSSTSISEESMGKATVIYVINVTYRPLNIKSIKLFNMKIKYGNVTNVIRCSQLVKFLTNIEKKVKTNNACINAARKTA